MVSRFDGRNEYNILQKVQAALHAISHLTIMPINPLFKIHYLFSLKIVWKFRQGIDERYVFKGVSSAAGNFGIFAVMVYT